jgi:hypothetical protein
MKTLFVVSILLCSAFANAKSYYISSNGNDKNNGLSTTSTWRSITKLNASFNLIAPGDSILFNRGDIFYGTVNIGNSGNAANPITVGAFGTGVNPIITGFTTIAGWTNEGGGIYSKIISSDAQTNMVTIDGVQFGVGRYPDTGWLTTTGSTSNTKIVVAGLGASVNWKGAGLSTKKNDYQLDRNVITNHAGDELTYSGGGGLVYDHYGTFICNDLRTLTMLKENFICILVQLIPIQKL